MLVCPKPFVAVSVTVKLPQLRYELDGLFNVEFTPPVTPKFQAYDIGGIPDDVFEKPITTGLQTLAG